MTDTALPIADTPEALTAAWLSEVLTRSGVLHGERIVDVSTRPIGTGQMCDSVRVTLTYDRPTTAPASVVAKLPAADETSRTTSILLRTSEREVRFYQELADRLPIRTPTVHHADIEVSTASFVLLLEDLAPGEQGDQLAGCSPEEAELAVTELVRLHAPRWGDTALAGVEWLTGDPENNRAMMTMMMPTMWDGFRERYEGVLDPSVHIAGDQIFAHLADYMVEPDGPQTIVHGDYRLDNLLFDPTPGGSPIAVVDWQMVSLGVGPSDVAFFLGAGLLPETRRTVEVDLVHAYHDGLLAAGVEGYDWDDCWLDYRRGTWSGLMVTVGASMLVERTERGDEMFMAMASRHSQHALDLDGIGAVLADRSST